MQQKKGNKTTIVCETTQLDEIGLKKSLTNCICQWKCRKEIVQYDNNNNNNKTNNETSLWWYY